MVGYARIEQIKVMKTSTYKSLVHDLLAYCEQLIFERKELCVEVKDKAFYLRSHFLVTFLSAHHTYLLQRVVECHHGCVDTVTHHSKNTWILATFGRSCKRNLVS